MKQNKILSIIISAFAAFLILILLAANITVLKPKTHVAFYDVGQNDISSVKNYLENLTDSKGKKTLYKFYQLNSDQSLAQQIKSKYNILICSKNLNVQEYISSKSTKKRAKLGPDVSILSDMTISVKQSAITTKNAVNFIPLLLDNNEIDIDRSIFKQSKIPAINSWNDVENFAAYCKKITSTPIIFAGASDDTILGILGSLTEALSGQESYLKLVDSIKNLCSNKNVTHTAFENLIQECTVVDGPLFYSLKKLKSWYKNGLLAQNFNAITLKDLQFYMENTTCPVALMTLSQHRSIPYKAITKYSSIYYPSEISSVQRYFSASQYGIIQLKNNKRSSRTINNLISNKGQETLSSSTGLAPVLANCSAADKQADDVRYWIAGTNQPNMGLAADSFTDNTYKHYFAEAIRTAIRH